MFLLIAQL